MISAISWVPKGASKVEPEFADPPSKEEIEEIKAGLLHAHEDGENDNKDHEGMNLDTSKRDDEIAQALAAADALGKGSNGTIPGVDSIADAVKELDMDNYDEEDDVGCDSCQKPDHTGLKCSVASDVESLAWDPHAEHSFVVSLDNGMVTGFDVRAYSSNSSFDPKPSFTLHAHDKAVCSISYNRLVPNLLATGSMDKMVKLWDLSNNQPSCVASRNPKAVAVFSVSFSDDCPFLLAVGGSKGKLELWETLSEAAVSGKYGKYNQQKRSPGP